MVLDVENTGLRIDLIVRVSLVVVLVFDEVVGTGDLADVVVEGLTADQGRIEADV